MTELKVGDRVRCKDRPRLVGVVDDYKVDPYIDLVKLYWDDTPSIPRWFCVRDLDVIGKTTNGGKAVIEPGEVYESKNGNLYLVLPGGQEAYIGNRDPSRSDTSTLMKLRLPKGAKVVAKLTPLPWDENNEE